jgi:hypothetical protein
LEIDLSSLAIGAILTLVILGVAAVAYYIGQRNKR